MAAPPIAEKTLAEKKEYVFNSITEIKKALELLRFLSNWDILPTLSEKLTATVDSIDSIYDESIYNYLNSAIDDVNSAIYSYRCRCKVITSYITPKRESDVSDNTYDKMLGDSFCHIDSCFMFRDSALANIDLFINKAFHCTEV